jgi:hypothetical protein
MQIAIPPNHCLFQALCHVSHSSMGIACSFESRVKRKPLNFQNCVKFPTRKIYGSRANSVPCGLPQHRVRYGTPHSQATVAVAGSGVSATIGECCGFPLSGNNHSHGLGRKVDFASRRGKPRRHDNGFHLVRRSRISDMMLHVLFFGPLFWRNL